MEWKRKQRKRDQKRAASYGADNFIAELHNIVPAAVSMASSVTVTSNSN